MSPVSGQQECWPRRRRSVCVRCRRSRKADPVVDRPSRSSTISVSARSQGCRAAGPRTARPTSSTPSSTRSPPTYPTQVVVKEAPYKSIQGRDDQVRRDHQQRRRGRRRQARVLQHGRRSTATRRRAPRTASSSPTTCCLQAKTNPKVAALLDKVRLIDLPLTNPDGHAFKNAAGQRRPAPRELRSLRRDRPARHVHAPRASTSTATIRSAGARTSASRLTARGSGPGSEPEVKNTMDIVPEQPGRDAGDPAHELARDLLPGPGDLRRPDAGPQQRLPRPRAGDGPRDRRRLHQRPRLRARLRDQRRDGRLVLLRDPRHRQHARARRRRRRLPAGAPALPAVHGARLHRHRRPGLDRRADRSLPGPPGPQRDLAEPRLRVAGRRALADHRHRRPRRDAEDHEGLQPLHGAGADRQHGRRRCQSQPRPVDAAAGDPDAPRVLAEGPGHRRVQVGRQPVRPSRPGLRGRRRARRPARLLRRRATR